MLSFIQAVDTALFRFFNITLGNPFTDWLMPFVTNGEHWVIAVALWVLFLWYKEGRRGLAVTAGIVVVFALCDQASAHWIKPWIERVRPCHVVEGARVLVGCSGAYSFPSAHATNTFGCAVFLAHVFPRQKWFFFGLSLLVSSSRVFVGVHYPLDVLGGWLLGLVIALAVVYMTRVVQQRLGVRIVAD